MTELSDREDISDLGAVRRMYRITADYERSFDTKVSDLLELGRAYLGVQAGFLTEISDDEQVIVNAVGDHPLLQPGESCPLDKTYCRRTLSHDDSLTVQHAEVEGWEEDSAYQQFGLESYIGAKVIVDDEIYGTFCFADTEPRERPFSDAESTFVELMAEWVSYELFQKQATERIQRQRDQLEEFAKVVSHDLRNPLSVVQGYLDLAEETGDPDHYDRCRDALDRMETLIEDLLVLAREGESIDETEAVDVGEAASDCWSFVATADATLTVEIDRRITADGTRLQQLFENLFRNAIEHGGDDVAIRVGELADGSGFFVADDGPGITPADRERVLDHGYSTADDGTGFGLTIVTQIADAHGWDVTVTESDDGGARFEIAGVD
ncbi:GAF domain-containing sensor histidine kinase [Halobaculum magnesiiphilum]|uniref:histidine kinase n=1 Tax=Halobaculum magnesiiphilum TaxID=1017351 RepID=A0A8T8WAP4_9EURY|nr:GAF domain-containing sensor histidine kinase [Halobaculum magnesiiphilum]QZP36898.1 GAF domain-containing sensor histidine kinase [Halobaculum magnesiiphilum]